MAGSVAYAEITQKMREEVGPTDDDSDDYVGLIRYAEGVQVALFLREDDPENGRAQNQGVGALERQRFRRRPFAYRSGAVVTSRLRARPCRAALPEAKGSRSRRPAPSCSGQAFEV